MNCMYCQGKMARQNAPFEIDRKGFHLTLQAVPAWVCVQCGEVYFETGEVDAIQDMLTLLEEKMAALEPIL